MQSLSSSKTPDTAAKCRLVLVLVHNAQTLAPVATVSTALSRLQACRLSCNRPAATALKAALTDATANAHACQVDVLLHASGCSAVVLQTDVIRCRTDRLLAGLEGSSVCVLVLRRLPLPSVHHSMTSKEQLYTILECKHKLFRKLRRPQLKLQTPACFAQENTAASCSQW